MGLKLSTELEGEINELVASGAYPSADAVLREGLDLLIEYRRRRAALQADLDEGMRDLEAGRMSDEPFSALIPELEAKLKARRRA